MLQESLKASNMVMFTNSKYIPYHDRLASKRFNFFSEISVCLKHGLANNHEIFI